MAGLGSPDDAARSVIVTFKNHIDVKLSLTDAHLDHGIWSENKYPPEHINPGKATEPTTTTWAAESQGFLTGTEGYTTYTFPDGQTVVKVYFDNPYAGSNSYSITISGPEAAKYKGLYEGGSGNNASVRYDLRVVEGRAAE